MGCDGAGPLSTPSMLERGGIPLARPLQEGSDGARLLNTLSAINRMLVDV